MNDHSSFAYVKALYDLGVENKLLGIYYKAAKEFAEVIDDGVEIIDFLSSWELSYDKKYQFLSEIFTTKNYEYFINWIMILIKNRKIKQFKKILEKFIHLYHLNHNVLEGTIWTTYPLSKEEISKIESIITKKYNKKTFLMNKLDRDIICGIKIEVGNNFWENNVLNSLNQMIDNLMRE